MINAKSNVVLYHRGLKDDIDFLEKAMNYFNLQTNLILDWSGSTKKHPDIWVHKENKHNTYTITVTEEWRKQIPSERRKRLVHELWHIIGHNHWTKPETISISQIKIKSKFGFKRIPTYFRRTLINNNNKLNYSTYPELDSWSWYLYYHVVF